MSNGVDYCDAADTTNINNDKKQLTRINFVFKTYNFILIYADDNTISFALHSLL